MIHIHELEMEPDDLVYLRGETAGKLSQGGIYGKMPRRSDRWHSNAAEHLNHHLWLSPTVKHAIRTHLKKPNLALLAPAPGLEKGSTTVKSKCRQEQQDFECSASFVITAMAMGGIDRGRLLIPMLINN